MWRFPHVFHTLDERSYVVIGVCDGNRDGGGGCAARGHPSHVLSFNHHHILALRFPVQGVYLAADHTWERETELGRRGRCYLRGERWLILQWANKHIANTRKTKHRPVTLSISKAEWSWIKEYLSSPLAVLGSSASVALTSTTLVPVFKRKHKSAAVYIKYIFLLNRSM